MKILITGGSGFIGKYLIQNLLKLNIEIIVIGRVCPINYTGEFIKADILLIENFIDLVNKTNADHLIHLAWYTEHQIFWNSELNLRWIDVSVRLAEAFCLAGGKKIIAFGSCAEYDWTYGYCREDNTPTNPKSLYGVSKDVTRRLFSAICSKYGVNLVWARVFFPYGVGEDRRKLIPALIRSFKGIEQPFSINFEAYRDFLHVTDVANAIIFLLNNDVDGCYNISSGNPILIKDLVHIIASICNKDPNIILKMKQLDNNTPIIIGDSSKLESLGWKTSDIVEQLENYCDELR